MLQVRSRVFMFVYLAFMLWLRCSGWPGMYKRLLVEIALIIIVSILLAIALPHLVMFYTSPFHQPLTGPGCGSNCMA